MGNRRVPDRHGPTDMAGSVGRQQSRVAGGNRGRDTVPVRRDPNLAAGTLTACGWMPAGRTYREFGRIGGKESIPGLGEVRYEPDI